MNKRSFFAILSALVVSAGTLGGFSSCNLSKANGNLPAVKDSTALFDYFTYKGNDDFYKENPLPDDESFYNPILPGWYSDPSICTNGEGDYFLVTSTFTYFPGVPIFHSRDLVNWKQVGHVLSRPSQLVNMKGQHVSGGIFAPAISYNPHNKTYYMVTTNVGAGNFFVKTQDPFGEWSDPIMLPEVGGIDPSFFFDEDIYVVSLQDGEMKKIKVKSRYIDKPAIKENPPQDFDGAMKASSEIPCYGNLIYDKYRKVYYRFVYLKTDLDGEKNYLNIWQYGRKSFSIMILNEDFDVIGETRFPDFTYISTLHYIGKDGLYLSDSHYKNPFFDENKLRFRRFKLVHYNKK